MRLSKFKDLLCLLLMSCLGRLWLSLGLLSCLVLTTEATKEPTIVLDVDNTLYRNDIFPIEDQIVEQIHSFCAQHCNLTRQQADDLHFLHGSTIEGLLQTHHVKDDTAFYDHVYGAVDVSPLLRPSPHSSYSTGYTPPLTSSLRSLLRHLPVGIASNSPRQHVQSVLQALGLATVSWRKIWTAPPTKTSRDFRAWWSTGDVLIDDSTRILQQVERWGIEAHAVTGQQSVLVALGRALGWQSPNYVFSQIEYLKAKNVVDAESIHVETWKAWKERLVEYPHLRIVDVGSGLLSMLRWIVVGHGDRLEPLEFETLEYFAYEPNTELTNACRAALEDMGFVLKETYHWDAGTDESLVEHVYILVEDSRQVTVSLRMWDYRQEVDRVCPTPHSIVGCCFADLMDPTELVPSLLHRFLSRPTDVRSCLLYFPITFRGMTQFVPPAPFQYSVNVPSDTLAFRLYSKALEEDHKHNLDPIRLRDTLLDYGATILSQGRSDWKIDATSNEYLWETMLYFFATTAAPELLKAGWNAKGWISRAREAKPVIQASNVDLLVSIPCLGCWELKPVDDVAPTPPKGKYQEIQFTAPGCVTSVEKKPPRLQPHEVRLKSLYSLVSSGTELKIFSGSFDDAALDTTIDGMKDERMSYPLAYGYSLVGQVVECGADVVDSADIMGRMAFAFSPHASAAVVDRSAIHLVPNGINPLDAIFMPSVETALSLVHDAGVLVGEKVAVFGQGLIGLLVTAILSSFRPNSSETMGKVGLVSAFDVVPDRLAESGLMGADQALESTSLLEDSFDVAIEVSGNGRALQVAIDSIVDGGKLIIGSWYGNDAVNLKLGIDFHRSQKTLRVSQVSNIPAFLSRTWTKERRFELTWELVRLLRPSRLISRCFTLDDSQAAYEALQGQSEVAIAFDYTR